MFETKVELIDSKIDELGIDQEGTLVDCLINLSDISVARQIIDDETLDPNITHITFKGGHTLLIHTPYATLKEVLTSKNTTHEH